MLMITYGSSYANGAGTKDLSTTAGLGYLRHDVRLKREPVSSVGL